MLVRTLQRMIERNLVEGLENKIDIFYAAGKITTEEYEFLINLLKDKQ